MSHAGAIDAVTEQLTEAVAAEKCHKCGCLQQTVEALAATDAGRGELAPILAEARRTFRPKAYDCLGCPVCYPAIAANAFSEAFPDAGARLELCPTDTPEERSGWPPLPGEYTVIRYRAPVAVCALNSDGLMQTLADRRPDGLAMVGLLRTENLGIERIIRNTVANPHLRFLVLAGQDTQQAVGHLPGQSLESLFRDGLDERGRIIGAKGRRPLLKNVSRDEVQAFVEQATLVSLIGEEDPDVVADRIRACAAQDPGPCSSGHAPRSPHVDQVEVPEPERLTLDRAGYFIVYPDRRQQRLIVEHYTNQGVLTCVLSGGAAPALYRAAVDRELLTRLDHAAYLGRELTRAEASLRDGTPFVQDAAPGALEPSGGACCTSGDDAGAARPATTGCCGTPQEEENDGCLVSRDRARAVGRRHRGAATGAGGRTDRGD